jgi:hypothetical protein
MKEIVKDYLFKSGAQRDPEKNHRFFIFMVNRHNLEWLIFAQCVAQYEQNPGKRKGMLINDWFLTPGSDKIPEELRGIIVDINADQTDVDKLATAQKNIATIQGIGTTFPDKARQHGVFGALKLIVLRETKPPADMFRIYKSLVEEQMKYTFDDFNDEEKIKIKPYMNGKTSVLKQSLEEATFNPYYMGVW